MIRFCAILALTLAFAAPAAAETMYFYLKNTVPFSVVVELSSEQTGTLWPGRGKVYLLDKGETKQVQIDCKGGENICYGAWRNGDDGRAWGVGPDRDRACEDCCYICVEKAPASIAIGG